MNKGKICSSQTSNEINEFDIKWTEMFTQECFGWYDHVCVYFSLQLD